MSEHTKSVDSPINDPDDAAGSPAGGDVAPGEIDGHAGHDGIVDLAWDVPMATIGPLAGALAGLMVWRFWLDPVLLPIVPLMGVLAAITVIDLRELRVPNAILKPAYAVGVPLLVVAALWSDWPELSLVRALIGAAALGAFYFILWFIYPPGMGFGDVKLAPMLGAQLALFSYPALVRGLFVAHVVGGIIGLVVLGVSRLRTRGDDSTEARKLAFPFAPSMVLGTVVALILETL